MSNRRCFAPGESFILTRAFGARTLRCGHRETLDRVRVARESVAVARTLWVLFKVTAKAVIFLATLGHNTVTAATLGRCRRRSAERCRRHLTSFSQPPADGRLHRGNAPAQSAGRVTVSDHSSHLRKLRLGLVQGFPVLTSQSRNWTLCLVVTGVELEPRLFTVLGPHVTLISLL